MGDFLFWDNVIIASKRLDIVQRQIYFREYNASYTVQVNSWFSFFALYKYLYLTLSFISVTSI